MNRRDRMIRRKCREIKERLKDALKLAPGTVPVTPAKAAKNRKEFERFLSALAPVVINQLLDDVQDEYPDVFPRYRTRVKAIVVKTGQKPRDVFFQLLAQTRKGDSNA